VAFDYVLVGERRGARRFQGLIKELGLFRRLRPARHAHPRGGRGPLRLGRRLRARLRVSANGDRDGIPNVWPRPWPWACPWRRPPSLASRSLWNTAGPGYWSSRRTRKGSPGPSCAWRATQSGARHRPRGPGQDPGRFRQPGPYPAAGRGLPGTRPRTGSPLTGADGLRIAYAMPLKPLGHGRPSGDLHLGTGVAEFSARPRPRGRVRGQSLHPLRLLGGPGAWPGLAAEASRSLTLARGADLWLTYHAYYKAPDVIGPFVSRKLEPALRHLRASTPPSTASAWPPGPGSCSTGEACSPRTWSSPTSAATTRTWPRIVPPERLATCGRHSAPRTSASTPRPGSACARSGTRARRRWSWLWPVPADVKRASLVFLLEALALLARQDVPFSLVHGRRRPGPGGARSPGRRLLPGRVRFLGRLAASGCPRSTAQPTSSPSPLQRGFGPGLPGRPRAAAARGRAFGWGRVEAVGPRPDRAADPARGPRGLRRGRAPTARRARGAPATGPGGSEARAGAVRLAQNLLQVEELLTDVDPAPRRRWDGGMSATHFLPPAPRRDHGLERAGAHPGPGRLAPDRGGRALAAAWGRALSGRGARTGCWPATWAGPWPRPKSSTVT
jgi:hypothetical protein